MTGKAPLLIGSFVGGCTLALFAWVLPSFVSLNMLSNAGILAGVVFGFVAALSAWHRDSKLARELRQAPEPAEAVWADCKRDGTPYAVYLRSFNYERLQNPFPIPIARQGGGGSARRVELRLVKALRGRLPVLALADPDYPFSMPGAHRFGRLAMPWAMFLEPLLQDAPLIIFYTAEINPALAFEINLVRELGLTGKSLVILGPGAFGSFADFKWVVAEGEPDLENTLAEIVESLANAGRERSPDEPALAASPSGSSRASRERGRRRPNRPEAADAKYLLKAAQVFIFLLPLMAAFKVWGAPDILRSEYWRYNKSMREIRKSQEESRRATDRFRRQAIEIQKASERIRNPDDNRKNR